MTQSAHETTIVAHDRSGHTAQKPVPLRTGLRKLWRHRARDKATCLGIVSGDISQIRDIDVWVNPENTYMEMARIYDRSISSIIRYLGASWSRNGTDSDDYIFRQLMEEVSARWGVHRPVPDGSVFLTRPGRLNRTHNVRAVAHVACVRPQNTGLPGCGYVPVDDLAVCVRNVLGTIENKNRGRAKYKSLLMPLMGSGTGAGDVRMTSEMLINAAADHIEHNPDARLKTVYFLAYNSNDWENIAGALENLTEFERA